MSHMKFKVRTVSGDPVFEGGPHCDSVECEFGSLEQLRDFAMGRGELIVNFVDMTIRVYDDYE